MRLQVAAILSVLLFVHSAHGDDASVELRDLPGDGKWQEVRGLVEAPMSVVHDWLTDYASWPFIFTDVASVEIGAREGDVTVVYLRSRGFKRLLELRIRPTPTGLIYEGQTGSVRTQGKIFLTDAGNGATDVIIQNMVHVGGLLGAFAPRGVVRDRQRAKLRTDLVDLQQLARRRMVAREATAVGRP